MKTLLPLAAALVLAATLTSAKNAPGSHFIDNWDIDEDGAVSLAEAVERRTDFFVAYDADENNILDAEEYALFDEARATGETDGVIQDSAGTGATGSATGGATGGANTPQGNPEVKKALKKVLIGMTLEYNDTDGNGVVSLEEFLGKTADWVAMLDRNGDEAISTADFGPMK